MKNSRRVKGIGKRKDEDYEKMKHNQNIWQRKHRKVENACDRLREFKEASMYNAVFICTCCHQRMFKSNVRIFTDGLKTEINKKKAGLTYKCIENVIQTRINGKDECYICLTCVRHLRNKRMPPMSTMNGLKLAETDK